MAILTSTLEHLLNNVLEAASEYHMAEGALSQAQQAGNWDKEAKTAKRKAAELAIAIDVGKYGGFEVLVRDKTGTSWKFLGDAPVVVGAWFRYLRNNGATLPSETIQVCGIQVNP